jgi:sarcosine oxidase subunit beta
MKTCDVLVVGSGVIGASAAYHLALSEIKNIIVIDKAAAPGQGSTGKATGGFRAQFGSGIGVKLSLLSRKKLLTFKEETGVDPGYLQYGYLFIAKSAGELERLRAAVKIQKESGLDDVREVDPDEIKELNPFVEHSGIIGGTFSPTDGFISPLNILKGYREAAERRGVTFGYSEELKGFKLSSAEKKITEVITTRNNYSAGCVINAAGAWAGEIGRLAGADIPVVPLKRQVACLKETNILPANLPMTIFTEDSFHFRMRDGALLLLLPSNNEITDPYDTTVEDGWLNKINEISRRLIPKIAACSIDKQNSWTGLYEMSPDEHALLGLAPNIENFYLANGSSGHGVMHSPAIGQLLAEIIIDGKAKTIDTRSLRPSRFMEGEPIDSIKFF